MRVFNLKSTSGSFEATEVLNPGRSEHTTPYPILQSQLYSADQPGKNSIWSDLVFLVTKYFVHSRAHEIAKKIASFLGRSSRTVVSVWKRYL